METQAILKIADDFYRWLAGGKMAAVPEKYQVKAPAGNPPAVVNKPAATIIADKDKDWERMGEERKVIDEIDQQLRDAAIQQRYNTTEIQAHIFEKYGENDTKHLTYEQKKELVKDLKLGKVTRQKAPKQ
jgi:hypothetical protein